MNLVVKNSVLLAAPTSLGGGKRDQRQTGRLCSSEDVFLII